MLKSMHLLTLSRDAWSTTTRRWRIGQTGLKVIYVAEPEGRRREHVLSRAPLPGNGKYQAWAPMDAGARCMSRAYVRAARSSTMCRWHAVSRETASPVLFVTYEELKRDPATGVRKIADHLGLERSDEDINAVVRLSSFDAMAAQARKAPRPGDARNAKYATLTNGAVDAKGAASHLRQGGAGTWVQHFSPLLSKQFDAAYQAAMVAAAGLGGPPPAFDFGPACDVSCA